MKKGKWKEEFLRDLQVDSFYPVCIFLFPLFFFLIQTKLKFWSRFV